jgi:hypothetical protein
MFHEERRSVPETIVELREEYAADLRTVVEGVGVDAAVDRTGLDEETVTAVAGGDVSGLSLEEAGAIQALVEGERTGPGVRDAETVVETACDHLLLGMSTAVLDVDTVAAELPEKYDLTPKEVQQKLERRAETSFEEYVALQYVIAGRQP